MGAAKNEIGERALFPVTIVTNYFGVESSLRL
jgi:hypothetical protein